ncbi:Lrp/AsnC family transcriptional regulator [Hydrogenophaga sp.]|uniref:Lrp/AsnC family transcriptional regulator n=1 Tax=Hydrogenophaga sp. TaxID=1904254 RepID=UPI0019CD3206|nr:Lrp/AsnC family transcriptional regulator [Hydrogenophaga sp.]MBD3892892.1 Lrp/AsnC family transcriptional regulator [Hydrogenophaga sp.]
MKDYFIDKIDLRLLDLLQTDASRSNQALAEQAHLSPATSLRRVKRLRRLGLIERQVALLDADRLAPLIGHGLTALVEITLERQGAEELQAFETHVLQHPAVQQCYRVSPGPDFMLVLHCAHMQAHLELAQELFTSQANVRNVKTFFSLKRAKFDPRLPLQACGVLDQAPA